MKKIIIIVALVDMILIGMILTMVIKADGEYVTALEGLRIRAEPSTEAEIFEVLPFGAEVSGEIEAGWMRLEGRDGYACADYVSVDDPHEGMELLGTWRVTAYAERVLLCQRQLSVSRIHGRLQQPAVRHSDLCRGHWREGR